MLSCSVMSDSLWPTDCSPPGSSVCGISQATHSLLQGIVPTQGSNLGLLYCKPTLYQLSPQGSLCKRHKEYLLRAHVAQWWEKSVLLSSAKFIKWILYNPFYGDSGRVSITWHLITQWVRLTLWASKKLRHAFLKELGSFINRWRQ